MSLQIKKPLSAQAVGTDMYKNGGVSHSHPATKQPEWSTKSLLHWETDEKKKTSSSIQNIQPDWLLGPEAPADQQPTQSWMTSGVSGQIGASVGGNQERWRRCGWLADAVSGWWIHKMSACAHAVRDRPQTRRVQDQRKSAICWASWLHFHHSEKSHSLGSY